MEHKNDEGMSGEGKEVCMACSCPCEMHKEHNHPVDTEAKKAEGAQDM